PPQDLHSFPTRRSSDLELRISYLPQPANRWLRAGLLDRPWRRAVLINAIDYERLPRDEIKALVAHEMVHLRRHHDLLYGVQLRLDRKSTRLNSSHLVIS